MELDRKPPTYIEMKTAIPGPNAQQLLERRIANIPRGPFNTVPTFAGQSGGSAAHRCRREYVY